MNARSWAGLFTGLGVLMAGVALWHLLQLALPSADWLHTIVDATILGGSAVVLLHGGYWHLRRSFPSDRYPRIVAWMVGSGLLLASIGLISLYIGSRQVTGLEAIESITVSGSAGLAFGLLVGTIEARSIVNAEEAARARARASALEDAQERREELNDLLRHYTLNGMNVIEGYARELRPVVPDENQSSVDTIEARADMVTTLVEHIRSLPLMAAETEALQSVDLANAVESALADCAPPPEVTVTAPATAPDVRAPDGLTEGLALLFDATVLSTDAGGRMTISVETTGDDVTLRTTATPATLPPAIEESLFEPVASGIGLELYLADQVLGQFGDLELTTNADETVTFDLHLDPSPPDTSTDRARSHSERATNG